MKKDINIYLAQVKKTECVYDNRGKCIDIKVFVKPLNINNGMFSSMGDDIITPTECNIMSPMSIDPAGSGSGIITRPHDGALCMVWKQDTVGELGKDIILGFLPGVGNSSVSNGTGFYSVPEIPRGGIMFRTGSSSGSGFEFSKDGIKIIANPMNSLHVSDSGIKGVVDNIIVNHSNGWFNQFTSYVTKDTWDPLFEVATKINIHDSLSTVTADKQTHCVQDLSSGEIYNRSALIDSTKNSVSYGVSSLYGSSYLLDLLKKDSTNNISSSMMYSDNGFLYQYESKSPSRVHKFKEVYDSNSDSYEITLIDNKDTKALIKISANGVSIKYKKSEINISSDGEISLKSEKSALQLDSVVLYDGIMNIWNALSTHTHTVATTGNAGAQTGTTVSTEVLVPKTLITNYKSTAKLN